jgi:hypothetical protein
MVTQADTIITNTSAIIAFEDKHPNWARDVLLQLESGLTFLKDVEW